MHGGVCPNNKQIRQWSHHSLLQLLYLEAFRAGWRNPTQELFHTFILDVKVILQVIGRFHVLGISIAKLFNNAWLPNANYPVSIIVTLGNV